MKKILTSLFLLFSMWLAMQIGSTFPLIGNSIAAILIGSIIRHTPLFEKLDKSITKFVSKYMLKTGIVLLGFTLSLRVVGQVGPSVLIVLAGEITASILTAILVNKLLKVNNKLALLLGIGTSICGGAAIVASAPILEAEDEDVAVSITTMFIFSILALFILPVIGKTLGYTDQLYGILAGSAVNDTASVVATSFEWSDAAGKFATVVKLVRTLFLVPVTLGVIMYKFKTTSKSSSESKKIDWKQIVSIIPVFVVLFVGAVAIASVFSIPKDVTSVISKVSKYFMTIALVTIGLGVHVRQIKEAGIKPVLLGGLCWSAVLAVSISLIGALY